MTLALGRSRKPQPHAPRAGHTNTRSPSPAVRGPQDKVLPADLRDYDQLRPAIQKLSADDQALFARYAIRTSIGAAFGGGGSVPAGMTIGRALEDQRTFEKDEEKMEAESGRTKVQKEAEAAAPSKARLAAAKAAALEELGKVLTVLLVEKKFVPGRFSDHPQAHLDVTLADPCFRGTKAVAGFQGTAVFTDMFGDVSPARGFTRIPNGLAPPGAERTSSWSTDYNQFNKDDKRFAEAETEKIRFTFEPTVESCLLTVQSWKLRTNRLYPGSLPCSAAPSPKQHLGRAPWPAHRSPAA